jgi:hypothetical protein
MAERCDRASSQLKAFILQKDASIKRTSLLKMPFTFDPTGCPRCKSADIKRSKFRNLFELVFAIAFVACRCYNCEKRFFRPRWHGLPPDWPKRSRSASVGKSA